MGGSGLGFKTSGVGRGLFRHNPSSKQQCSVEALTGRYLVLIIAELGGRSRQSPIVLGGEGQSLGTKDALSIRPVNTH